MNTEKQLLRRISRIATKSEKTAWARKYEKMQGILKTLKPIEDRILDITINEKQPILDEVAILRKTMISECVHPYEHLVYHDKHIECKFCNKRLVATDG